MKYAGIGSRRTPPAMIKTMEDIGNLYSKWTCCTGACKGADQAFANAAVENDGKVELFLPWGSYEQEWIAYLDRTLGNKKMYNMIETKVLNTTDYHAYQSVQTFHPAPEKLSQGVIKLHARNYLIIENCDFVVCWTPGGKIDGGTGQGIRIANSLNIPVWNLGNPDTLDKYQVLIDRELS